MINIITREQRRQLARENAKLPTTLKPVQREQWPDISYMTKKPISVWRSRFFLVQSFDEGSGITRISVAKAEIDANGRWKDGITWDELQEIKRQIGFGDSMAVEIFPADRAVVNVANMRHLWVLRDPLPFAWNNIKSSGEKCKTCDGDGDTDGGSRAGYECPVCRQCDCRGCAEGRAV